VIIATVALLLAADGPPKTLGDFSPEWKRLTVEQKGAEIREIARACHLPAGVLQFKQPDEVRFQPSANAKYEDIDCALAKLMKSRGTKGMGFVGNEKYWDDKH